MKMNGHNVTAAMVLGAMMVFAPLAFAETPTVPTTPAEHQAMARLYRDKAATYQKEADWHKQMVESYKKARDSKGRPANDAAAIKKMEGHCADLAKQAAQLATDATKVAELHERQAAATEKGN